MTNNTVIHRAASRGYANHGWLEARHTFSFADYYDPERIHFGVLRVLNDDSVSGGSGFGMHPHDNMEIITIPLEGALEHKDSMGNTSVIQKGEIQVMSAGTGIYHSERNHNHHESVKLLQIWVFPNKQRVTPRYQQIALNVADRKNTLQQILSPNQEDAGVWIHQQAWFHLGVLDTDFSTEYNVHLKQNGIYVFVITGSVQIDETILETRDGMGIWDTEKIQLISKAPNTEVLIMEVPMEM